jgi:hypothetical protein
MLPKFQHRLYWPHDPADGFFFQGLLIHIPEGKNPAIIVRCGLKLE